MAEASIGLAQNWNAGPPELPKKQRPQNSLDSEVQEEERQSQETLMRLQERRHKYREMMGKDAEIGSDPLGAGHLGGVGMATDFNQGVQDGDMFSKMIDHGENIANQATITTVANDTAFTKKVAVELSDEDEEDRPLTYAERISAKRDKSDIWQPHEEHSVAEQDAEEVVDENKAPAAEEEVVEVDPEQERNYRQTVDEAREEYERQKASILAQRGVNGRAPHQVGTGSGHHEHHAASPHQSPSHSYEHYEHHDHVSNQKQVAIPTIPHHSPRSRKPVTIPVEEQVYQIPELTPEPPAPNKHHHHQQPALDTPTPKSENVNVTRPKRLRGLPPQPVIAPLPPQNVSWNLQEKQDAICHHATWSPYGNAHHTYPDWLWFFPLLPFSLLVFGLLYYRNKDGFIGTSVMSPEGIGMFAVYIIFVIILVGGCMKLWSLDDRFRYFSCQITTLANELYRRPEFSADTALLTVIGNGLTQLTNFVASKTPEIGQLDMHSNEGLGKNVNASWAIFTQKVANADYQFAAMRESLDSSIADPSWLNMVESPNLRAYSRFAFGFGEIIFAVASYSLFRTFRRRRPDVENEPNSNFVFIVSTACLLLAGVIFCVALGGKAVPLLDFCQAVDKSPSVGFEATGASAQLARECMIPTGGSNNAFKGFGLDDASEDMFVSWNALTAEASTGAVHELTALRELHRRILTECKSARALMDCKRISGYFQEVQTSCQAVVPSLVSTLACFATALLALFGLALARLHLTRHRDIRNDSFILPGKGTNYQSMTAFQVGDEAPDEQPPAPPRVGVSLQKTQEDVGERRGDVFMDSGNLSVRDIRSSRGLQELDRSHDDVGDGDKKERPPPMRSARRSARFSIPDEPPRTPMLR